MRMWRNKEIRRLALCYTAMVLCFGAAAALVSAAAAGFVLLACAAGAVLFLLFTKRRYDALSDLTAQLDRILHGDHHVDLIPDEEGELALLASEISKMTLRLREQAERSERDKRYLSESLADISHQLRTPLTAMRMIVPRLRQENLSPEQRQRDVRRVEELLERTQWLIAALLKIARLESGTVRLSCEPVDVRSLIDSALEPLEILLDLKNMQLSLSVEEGARFAGDRLWSAEALGNILKNCVEHGSDGGVLEITGVENPLYTEITVADNGAGFAAEDIPHLFERFYRGRQAGKESAGIGLHLSRMIISRQNGTVKAENRPSGGALFQIRFYKGAV